VEQATYPDRRPERAFLETVKPTQRRRQRSLRVYQRHLTVPSPLATALAGLGGGAFLGVLVVLAAVRMLATRRDRTQRFERPPVLDLMALIFAAQLALFGVRETAEALLTGRAVPTAGDLLLWGTLGQPPIAALAAP
jgi:hypothetical protein